MRRITFLSVPFVFSFFAACGDSAITSDGGTDAASATDTSTGVDAAPPMDASNEAAAPDAGEPLTQATEVEPNDGKVETEVGTMVLPGVMSGTISPADDVDIFSVKLAPGEFWEWNLAPTTADLAPHLTVFDTKPNTRNPTALVVGTTGAALPLQHFVLNDGSFVAVVRDARNVPTKTGKGGPTFGYSLTGRRKAISAIAVTFPSTKTGRLGSLGGVDLYSFTGTAGKGFDVVLRAKRKSSPSTLDSRLSLFDVGAKRTLITNDNSPTTTDSQFGGDAPLSGTHYVIVDNEGTDATDLSYDLEFSLRP
jgi:hypothetical protein